MTTLVPKFQQTGTGAVNRSSSSKLTDTVSVFDFMTPAQIASVQARDYAVDVTDAIQAALDSVPNYPSAFCPSKASGGAGEIDIIFPDGTYVVSSVLVNNQRGWARLRGQGRVEINSSSTTYILDMASCYYCDVSNINFVSSTAGVGIYMNRCTSNPFTDYNTFNNLNVTMSAGITANGGEGTIGLYINRCEQNVFTNCAFNADIPLWNDQTSNASFPPTNGTQYVGFNSNTVNTFIQCNWTKYGSHNYGMILNGAISFEFINNYWNDTHATAGATPYMWLLNACSKCSFAGSFDSVIRVANVVAYNAFHNFNLLMPADSLDTGGVFTFDTAGTNVLVNSNFDIFTSGDNTGKYLFRQTSPASTAQVEGNTIKTLSTLTISNILYGVVTANIYQNEAGLSLAANSISSLQYGGVSGVTASTASATPVTVFTPVATYVYQVYAYVSGAGANYVATAIVVNDGTTNNLLSYSHGSGLTITVSGADIQCTQSLGSPYPITYRYIAIV